jgi:hypothetical protein
LMGALRAAITENERLACRDQDAADKHVRRRFAATRHGDMPLPPDPRRGYTSFKEAVVSLKASTSEWMKDMESNDDALGKEA